MDKPREFVTEDQLSEERKLRQQEWERVRRSDQPKEAPEPEIDCRPLYVRLQEQREKSQMEFEESIRLKHSIRGLDEEEVGFLHLVDCVREREQKKIKSEEDELIQEVRKKQSELTDECPVKLNLTEPSTTKLTEKKPKPVNKQAKLLLKAIKRKSLIASFNNADKIAVMNIFVRVKMTDDKQMSANSESDDEGEMVLHHADEDTEFKRFDANFEEDERNGRKRHQQPDEEKTDTDDGENKAKKNRPIAESSFASELRNQQAKGSERSDAVQRLDSSSSSSNSSDDSSSSSGTEILSCFLQNATWKHRRVFRRRD
ncbi:Uncharacterized protein T4A_7004 [Trichinella pseudospiralis]|uniref:FAM192A/Fyv6 N-terminal domain-containing protein n=1 Tax=Trichinella pseudospiralis TaxID=6337 RepID=A0A0V1DU92_TRIPS|nr:Uncharacterized protein T4A_7004 [Trichinella pseudospiralis]